LTLTGSTFGTFLGQGMVFCVGAPLTRLETQVTLKAML
jgi:hypothetical protein